MAVSTPGSNAHAGDHTGAHTRARGGGRSGGGTSAKAAHQAFDEVDPRRTPLYRQPERADLHHGACGPGSGPRW